MNSIPEMKREKNKLFFYNTTNLKLNFLDKSICDFYNVV